MRILLTGVLALVLVVSVSPPSHAVPGAENPRRVPERAAYLFDLTRGRELWRQDAHSRRPVASITKAMTAYVVISGGRLDRKIRIRRGHGFCARAYDGTSARLRTGDRLTARELLYALLLPSGCDAAVALADAYGPGRRAFVRKMNSAARRLGMRGTHFTNPDGLPYPRQGHSTAYDVVTLAKHALRLPAFRAVVARSRYVAHRNGGHRRYVWRNTNKLLRRYPGLVGIKTGYTNAAGYCLLFAARRSGRTLVGVVLNASRTDPEARFTAAARLLNWGFYGTP
jgi:serine-type D-Ala-D-Ala carboxypeptidase (penicillin-binding protein 5/6)